MTRKRITLKQQATDEDLDSFVKMVKEKFGVDISKSPSERKLCDHGFTVQNVIDLYNKDKELPAKHRECSRVVELYNQLNAKQEPKENLTSCLERDYDDLVLHVDEFGPYDEKIRDFVLQAKEHYDSSEGKGDFVKVATSYLFVRRELGSEEGHKYMLLVGDKEQVKAELSDLEATMAERSGFSNFLRGNYVKREDYQEQLKDLNKKLKPYEEQLK